MLTQLDIKNLLSYFSENYIICNYLNGDSRFIELVAKDDVIERFEYPEEEK